MRNIVLICFDAVRKDYFDQFAPRLQRRADTTYRQARASGAWSLPSHASIFTGELPHAHGLYKGSDRQFTDIGVRESFVSDLPDHLCIGVSANPYASRDYGFDSFFDVFSEFPYSDFAVGHLLPFRNLPDSSLGRSLTSAMDAAARSMMPDWIPTKRGLYEASFSGTRLPELRDKGTKAVLSRSKTHMAAEESADNPVFAFLNLMDAHGPMYHHTGLNRDLHSVPNAWNSKDGPGVDELQYDTEEYGQYTSNWRDLYVASVDYLDRAVDRWIDEVREITDAETTVVVTADHGHSLGVAEGEDHWGHSVGLTEAVLHVPLILVNPPDGYPEVERRLVSQLELGELLVHLAHDEEFQFSDQPARAEKMGYPGNYLTSKYTYCDRLVRTVYDGGRRIEWDSLGTTRTFELQRAKPCVERRVDTTTSLPPEDEDETLFETDVRNAKRTAVRRELAPRDHSIDEETRENLEDWGYV